MNKKTAAIPKAFISSTVEDLQPYRQAAKEAMLSAGFHPVMQEYFAAQSEYPPLEACLKKVDECDVLVVIVAYRQGWTPKEQPLEPGAYPGTKSITRLECERARTRGIEVLAFLVDETYEWPLEKKEEGRAATALMNGTFTPELPNEIQQNMQSIKDFKSWLSSLGFRKTFTTPESLEAPVAVALKECKERTYQKENKKGKDPHFLPAIPQHYKDWIRENFSHMDTTNIQSRAGVVILKLPEIFIPLFANPPKNDIKENTEKTREENIDTLIGVNEKLLIEGEAGSGKTTLLKHIAWILTQQGYDIPQELTGYLPLVIFLKDLPAYLKECPDCLYNAEGIIKWYLEKRMDKVLSFSIIEQYLASGKKLLLLDGLDEIKPLYRKRIIETFCNLRHIHRGTKIVFTGRPDGIEADVAMIFRDFHIKVNPFTIQQTEKFIELWFRYYYPNTIGKKTAQAMISEIESNEATLIMKSNPLMLTAICILYNDENRLPEQRAELFKKLVDNLLKRRFPEIYNKVHNYLKTLAFDTHKTHDKNIDKNRAVDTLKKVFEQQRSETVLEYQTRMEETFDEISSKCGLLMYKSGSYMFFHLSFQAFLTSRYIIDTYRIESNISEKDAIMKFIDDIWYNECIKLGIGYLSIDSNDTANSIVRSILEDADASLERKILATDAFVDIKESFRHKHLENDTKNILLGMIKEAPLQNRKLLAQAGELLGWLGDPRDDLRDFVAISGGEYSLEELGKVTIPAFEIGKYPVTNSWYEKFVHAGGYTNRKCWSDEGWQWREKKNVKYPGYWHNRVWKCPNAPVVGVSWYEADAFARWLTVTRNDGFVYRLPGQEEWQAAAAGFEGRKYPWGDEWDYTRCNCYKGDDTIGKTSSVGIFERGKTPDGIYDMAGNVWEWFSTCSGESRVVRGGSWRDDSHRCRCAGRYGYWPGIRYNSAGFRLARGHKRTSQDR